MNYKSNTFYAAYIPYKQVQSVLEQFSPSEQETAAGYLSQIMHYIVWDFIAKQVSLEDFAVFIDLQKNNPSDQSIIIWLQERSSEITIALPEILERNLLAVLKEQHTV